MVSKPPRSKHGAASDGPTTYPSRDVVRLLTPFISEERRRRIDEVVRSRIRSIIPVVDGVYDMGNINAVMRTAEGLGYQEMHIIQKGDRFKSADRVSQGAEKWLDVVRWDTTEPCVSHLKRSGYTILATHLDAALPIAEIDFTQKLALVFGNEAEGVSEEVISAADGRFRIPMQGFVQSFNVSVAAALTLYHACRERSRILGHHGDLKSSERDELRARFYMKSVEHYDRILARLTANEKK